MFNVSSGHLNHDHFLRTLIATLVECRTYAATCGKDFKKPIAEDVIKLAGGEVKFLTVVKQD